jgi:hypothetical protein
MVSVKIHVLRATEDPKKATEILVNEVDAPDAESKAMFKELEAVVGKYLSKRAEMAE